MHHRKWPNMMQALDYAPPVVRPPSRMLAICTYVSLAYPLFLVGSLYGEWFLAWHILGHEPRCSMDDPKFINGSSWMHPITGIAIMGLAPAAVGALVLNTLYVINRRPRGRQLLVHILCLSALWLGMIALLRFDPHPVLEWWFD